MGGTELAFPQEKNDQPLEVGGAELRDAPGELIIVEVLMNVSCWAKQQGMTKYNNKRCVLLVHLRMQSRAKAEGSTLSFRTRQIPLLAMLNHDPNKFERLDQARQKNRASRKQIALEEFAAGSQKLQLDGNNIATALSTITSFTTLVSLGTKLTYENNDLIYFLACNVSDTEVQSLSNLVSRNSQLTSLSLECNVVPWTQVFFNFPIFFNSVFKIVNSVSDVGAFSIGEALSINTALRKLNLVGKNHK